MATEPHEIILDHLRVIRASVAALKDDNIEIKASLNSLRVEVNALRNDILRQERAIAAVEVDVDRIKVRLDIADYSPNS